MLIVRDFYTTLIDHAYNFSSFILPVQTLWICCYKHSNNHNCWTIMHSTPQSPQIFMSRKSIISLVVLLLNNNRESGGPNCSTLHWIRHHFCFTKKAKSARMSQHLSVTQPVINTWLHHFINDKINTFSSIAILIYSDTTSGQGEQKYNMKMMPTCGAQHIYMLDKHLTFISKSISIDHTLDGNQ